MTILVASREGLSESCRYLRCTVDLGVIGLRRDLCCKAIGDFRVGDLHPTVCDAGDTDGREDVLH